MCITGGSVVMGQQGHRGCLNLLGHLDPQRAVLGMVGSDVAAPGHTRQCFECGTWFQMPGACLQPRMLQGVPQQA